MTNKRFTLGPDEFDDLLLDGVTVAEHGHAPQATPAASTSPAPDEDDKEASDGA